ncbi:MAG: DUF3232 domain-containing protein [Prevotella sp.]|nr:DUF3232 domain-containing protein [Prevotella sp.]
MNNDTLNGLIRHFKDDKDDMDMIVNAIEVFESYHQAIYQSELTRRLFSCDAIDSDTYRSEYSSRDRTRSVNHNAVIAQVGFLNRLAEETGLPPFYDGIVSEKRPYRRELANAVLDFVRNVIDNRI